MSKKRKPEIYVSLDIETDGPAPGLNSMLALGAVAYHQDGHELGQWYATMKPLPDAFQDTSTMDWWTTQPEAWAEVTKAPFDPERVVPGFCRWCEEIAYEHGGKLIAVGWPIAFDFAFVNYYCHRFGRRNPLGFSGLDIRSYANGLALQRSYYGLKEDALRGMSGPVDTAGLRDHFAIDDAIGQGRLFMALRASAASEEHTAFTITWNGDIFDVTGPASCLAGLALEVFYGMHPDLRNKGLSLFTADGMTELAPDQAVEPGADLILRPRVVH